MSALPPSLYRVPFLVFNLIAGHVATCPPNKEPGLAERKRYQNNNKRLEFLTIIQWWFLPFIWVVLYTFHLSEIYVTLASVFPAIRSHALLSVLLPTTRLIGPMSSRLHVSPTLLLGSFMCFFGCTLRYICYNTLGRQFTFELSLKKDHKLITHGPYSIVRHPSYIGSVIYFSGILIADFGAGSWFSVAGMWSTTFGRVLGTVWVCTVTFLLTSLVSRVPKEDKVLREEFGMQWVEWANKTPYRLIPGVY
ncbi:hypothetical protein BXZ70DRAFT_1007826 [Cristinia sonorae]|uniref:Protein-S-isoprenylcysteine O-methyltransferase n=1 Tax=Cristinia sonorae TaxID=1940300 RepID=A0A8K0UNH0_9AGAR|nr:hypothetical protein BXZ70DRAFT_1007826 [Cristinia sonorae]